MKWFAVVVLFLPMLGGCLANTYAEIPAPVVPSPQIAVVAAAPITAEPASLPDSPALLLFKPEFDNIFVDQSGIPYSLLDFEQLFIAVDEEAVENADDAEESDRVAEDVDVDNPEDPDALADKVILSGLEEAPPQDEGATLPADEVSFDFPVVENEKVHYYIDYYSGPAKKVFTRWLERSTHYLPLMQQIFAEEGLPRDLVYLALVESGFNNRAYSWAHAAGPWQFIRSTGHLYGLKNDWWYDERRDFEKATRAAARFLRDLHVRFQGDWYLALAGYNAGPGKIQRGIEKYESRDFWEISRHSYLANETKNYVPKLLATLLIAKQPEKYGFTEINYKPPVAFDQVTLPEVIDLEVVAKLCTVSYEEIRDLNPELSRWCTPPGAKDYTLRIPAGQKEKFERLYAALPSGERVNYEIHRIRSGETLSGLARKYKVRADDILAMNSLASPRSLRAGNDLIMPVRKGTPIPLQELRSAPSEARKQTYVVRKGDTLNGIGRKFNVSERDLKKWNRIANARYIKPGQVLSVSAKSAKLEKASNSVVYKVKKGDTLSGIATRHGVTVDQVVQWNGINRRQVLRIGEKLSLKPKTATKTASAGKSIKNGTKSKATAKTSADSGKRKITYKIRPGDTLWDIGRRFDVATHQIIKWNNLSANGILQPGAKLTLMVENGKQG